MEPVDFLMCSLRTVLETASEMIFIKDTQLVYVAASRTFAQMVGRQSGEELVGKTDFDLFSEELARKYTQDDKEVLKSEVPMINYVEGLPGVNGEKRYSSTSKQLIRDDKGCVIGLCGFARDITAQVELEEEKARLSMSNRMFDDVLEADITENRVLKGEGARWGKAFGFQEKTSFTQAVEHLASSFVHPDYAQEFRHIYWRERLIAEYEKGQTEFSHISYMKADSEKYIWLEISSRLYYSRVSGSLRIVTFLKDIDDRRRLEKNAETDALTGLYNRHAVLKHIEECLAGAGNTGCHALLFIDLDYFKQINDNLGHPFGDRVLGEMAQKIRRHFAKDAIVGRIGGDEFLVFLKNVGTKDAVNKQIESLFQVCSCCHRKGGREYLVTCSVGVSLYKGGGKSLSELYAQADKAMYVAKESGRNRASFYEP